MIKTFITVIIPTQLQNLIYQKLLFIPWSLARLTKGKYFQDKFHQQIFALTGLANNRMGLPSSRSAWLGFNSWRRQHSAGIWIWKSLMMSEQSSRKQLACIFFLTAFTESSSLLGLFYIQNQNTTYLILGKINRYKYSACLLMNFCRKVFHFTDVNKNFQR